MKPYTADAPNDWMNATASDLLDRYLPQGWRERSYADLLRASPGDWLGWIYPQYAGAASYPGAAPYPGPQRRAPGAITTQSSHPVYDVAWQQARPRHHPNGCRCPACYERECRHCSHCTPDACECFCCIGDVDFVAYTRVGEQRVLPIVVENERRRDKDISVELSGWRTRGGGAAPVDTVTVAPKAFKLPACAEKEVVIVARVREPADSTTSASTNLASASEREPEREPQRELKDVDGCLVVTADLTLVGCDHRPLRIGLAILPRDCDPFRVTCGCACC